MVDPISYLFSAYLNLVQQQVSDHYGSEPKTLVVQYEGEQVPLLLSALADQTEQRLSSL